MARIDKGALTKLEIISEATAQFLEKGYSRTTVSSIAKGLEMSPGNLTFHYPTKEHLLSELASMLCDFQWRVMEAEAGDGISSILALCLELTSMASACEEDEIIRDFFISSYVSPMCLSIIRKSDAKRAREVFAEYCPDWTAAQFDEAELLVSGIEYATFMVAEPRIPLETRITGALKAILSIYGVPKDIIEVKLEKVFALDYKNLSRRILAEFKEFVAETNEQAVSDLLHR